MSFDQAALIVHEFARQNLKAKRKDAAAKRKDAAKEEMIRWLCLF